MKFYRIILTIACVLTSITSQSSYASRNFQEETTDINATRTLRNVRDFIVDGWRGDRPRFWGIAHTFIHTVSFVVEDRLPTPLYCAVQGVRLLSYVKMAHSILKASPSPTEDFPHHEDKEGVIGHGILEGIRLSTHAWVQSPEQLDYISGMVSFISFFALFPIIESVYQDWKKHSLTDVKID